MNGGLVTWVHEIKSFVIAKKDLTRKLDPQALSKGSLSFHRKDLKVWWCSRFVVYTVGHYTTSFDKFWSTNLEDIYLDLFEKSAKKVAYEKDKDKRRVLFYEEVVKAVSTIRSVGKGFLETTTNLDTLV